MLRKLTAISLLGLCVAAAPAAAAPGILTQVQRTYTQDGRIPPCKFLSQQLESALKSIDTYGAQYFADFSSAVQTALQARAGGACAPSAGVQLPSPSPASAPARPLRLGPVTAATDAGLPAPIVLMAALLALFAVIGAIAAIAWWRGWDPASVRVWRHMWADAGYRARGTWLEVRDRRQSRSR